MSLDEARSVIWPFREIKNRPIGLLYDKGLLSLQDLGFAAQRAYDKRVRDAARTMLLHALTHERFDAEDSPGPLNVISSERRSFAERRQLEITMIMGGILGFILGIGIYALLSTLTQPSKVSFSETTNTTAGIIALVIVILGTIAIVFVANKLFDVLVFNRLFNQLQRHRKGQLGEDRVLNVMHGVFDGKWWLFQNLELPGRRLGDLDFVLVGPHGVWSFEVKAYSGEYRNVGEQWEKRYGTKWFPVPKSPTRQARRNAAELSQLLSTNQIKQWITPVIIWADPESTVALDNPSASVWTLDQLSEHLKHLSEERPIPEAQIQSIVEVLKKIYQDEAETKTEY
ncbi:MAG: NERD domain-containing protein [Chloroflexi bacterium]|nr:NERD domain-containing protein [Chloroflexota bacterium]